MTKTIDPTLASPEGVSDASLTPSGEAKVGSIVFVTQGKNYGKSEVTVVEPSKTIKTKLIETSWPANYWNESWHLYEDGRLHINAMTRSNN